MFCWHKYVTKGISSAFHTDHTINGKIIASDYHFVKYMQCKKCGKRKFIAPELDHHNGLKTAKVFWEEQGIMKLATPVKAPSNLVVFPGGKKV